MYPIIRLTKERIKFRNAPALAIDDVHVSTHICWPIDIDIFGEMNNGRILTLYDLGRLAMGKLVGLIAAIRKNGWGLTMAGASVRYRRRVKVFQRLTIKTRALGRDDKFIYLQQTMWRKGEAASPILYRSAVTDKNEIVPAQKVGPTGLEPKAAGMGVELDYGGKHAGSGYRKPEWSCQYSAKPVEVPKNNRGMQ